MTKKQREELLNEVDPGEMAARGGRLAAAAWKKCSIVNHQVRKFKPYEIDQDGVPSFGSLDLRQKQRAVGDWLLALTSTHEMRAEYATQALQDPMTHMKLVLSMMPKQMEVVLDARVGLVVLPAKMGVTDDWVGMATGEKPIDAEVIDSEEALTAAETWQRVMAEQVEREERG